MPSQLQTTLSRQGTLVRERGVSLLFALLALVSLSLASVALVRSVDTGTLVMGNLGFKQDATSSADKATQHAITHVINSADLNRDADSDPESALAGYYAMAHESIDVTGQQTSNASRELVNWDVDDCAYASNAAQATCNVRPSDELEFNGNKMRYVIFRLCSAVGAPDNATNPCARPKAIGGDAVPDGNEADKVVSISKGELRYGIDRPDLPPEAVGGKYQGVYYRIVVRVIGARNTTSFVETIVHL